MALAAAERDELLRVELTDAWNEYLESVRRAEPLRYDEIEPWAWARLQQRLRSIRARQRTADRARA